MTAAEILQSLPSQHWGNEQNKCLYIGHIYRICWKMDKRSKRRQTKTYAIRLHWDKIGSSTNFIEIPDYRENWKVMIINVCSRPDMSFSFYCFCASLLFSPYSNTIYLHFSVIDNVASDAASSSYCMLHFLLLLLFISSPFFVFFTSPLLLLIHEPPKLLTLFSEVQYIYIWLCPW